MIGYLRAQRSARRARRLYELARIECLMAENQRRLDEIARRDAEDCPLCERTAPSEATS